MLPHFVICWVDWPEPQRLHLKLEIDFPIITATVTQEGRPGVWKSALHTERTP